MSGKHSFRVDKGSHTNTPLRGNNTWAKIWSEATQPTCYCPRELATDYSGLLCENLLETSTLYSVSDTLAVSTSLGMSFSEMAERIRF